MPPLAGDQQTLDTVEIWNGKVVVQGLHHGPSYNRVSIDAGRVEPLTCPAGKPFDLADSRSAAFALCRGARGFRLYTVRGPNWTETPIPKQAARAEALRVCASSSRVFLLGKDTIYSRRTEASAWETIHYTPPEPELRAEFPFAKYLLATDRALYFGWNWGEWGGGAEKVAISEDRSGVALSPTGMITSEPVTGIVAAPDGVVWITTGLAHLSGLSAGLYRDDGTGVTPWIVQSNYHGSSGRFSLPGDTEISGLMLGPGGAPYVVASELGIFEVSDAGPRAIVAASLRIEYHSPLYGPNTIVGSAPQGIASPDGKTLVVATRSTGVLVFEPHGDGYSVRQIRVP